MKKHRILVLNLTPRGGMLHYASQFCNELVKNEHIELRVGIASYCQSVLYDTSIQFFKIRTYPDIYNFFIDTCNIFYQIIFLLRIIFFHPDIVHFIDNHPWYSFYVRIFKKLGYTIYVTQHDPILHSGEASTLLGKVAGYTNHVLRGYADKIFVHGYMLKQDLESIYHISPAKVFDIPHGAYTFFHRFGSGAVSEKNTFLFFGRIVDYKGLDVLLETLVFVREQTKDFKLIIAGSGDLSPYKNMLREYQDYLEIHNYEIPDNEVYKYFERSEFVVLPYKDATGSGVIPVAYSFSKPVIVTNVGNFVSVVQEGKTGFIVPVCDPKSFSQKILFLLENKQQTHIMGANARHFSDTELSWKPIVERVYFVK